MKAIGIILAGGNNNRMKELTAKRAVPALPVAGSFRSIDFALSSMSNSHIQTVAVLTQYNARSLNEHLSSSKWWNFGRKQGGLFLFTPTVTADNSDWYRGTADAMYQNIDFLKRRHEPYVIISSGDCVYKLDFNRVLDFHIEKKSDITVVCKDTISTGIYVIRRRQLIELLEAAAEENRFDFVNDILVRYKNVKKIYGYKINSYWNNIADIDAYFKTNMDFLRPDVRSYFFREEPTICSKVDDLPPAKFNPGSDISNSLVSSGCIINGSVEDSVLFKQVFVGKNTTVKNCVLLNDVYIGDNVHLENCIVESHGTINPNTCYCGEDGVMIVKEKNVRYVI